MSSILACSTEKQNKQASEEFRLKLTDCNEMRIQGKKYQNLRNKSYNFPLIISKTS